MSAPMETAIEKKKKTQKHRSYIHH